MSIKKSRDFDYIKAPMWWKYFLICKAQNTLSEDGEIKYIKFDDYVSFMLGAKAENNELFKTLCNNAEMEQN